MMRDTFDNQFGTPVVDFDYFDFDDTSDSGMLIADTMHTRDVASRLAEILIANISQDDLQWTTEFDPNNNWPTTVGSGGSGMIMACATQAHQRAILASHFASYALSHYDSCYLALPDYQCLLALHNELDTTGLQGSRLRMLRQNLKLLKRTCQEFEVRYAKEDPTFLFQYIKTR